MRMTITSLLCLLSLAIGLILGSGYSTVSHIEISPHPSHAPTSFGGNSENVIEYATRSETPEDPSEKLQQLRNWPDIDSDTREALQRLLDIFGQTEPEPETATKPGPVRVPVADEAADEVGRRPECIQNCDDGLSDHAEMRQHGRASITWLGQSQLADVRFSIFHNHNTHQSTVVLNSSSGDTFEYMPEVGQVFVDHISTRHIDGLGNVVCIYYASGAVSQGLKVLLIGPDGKWKIAFNDTRRFGFKILRVTGNSVENIVGGDGDLYGAKLMSVFGWNGDSYTMLSREAVDMPHAYDIRVE